MNNKRKPITLQGGKQYTKVVDRLKAWRSDYSVEQGYKIVTCIHTLNDNYVVFKCEILNKENQIVATGHGFNAIARDKSLEKAETVAVGRALAIFDPIYGGDTELASMEEIEKFEELNKPQTQPVNAKPNGVANVVAKAKEQLSHGTNGHNQALPKNDPEIPFNGKNKGKRVSDINTKSLDWYIQNMDLTQYPGLESSMREWFAFKTQS